VDPMGNVQPEQPFSTGAQISEFALLFGDLDYAVNHKRDSQKVVGLIQRLSQEPREKRKGRSVEPRPSR
jgi:hypothetical protein